MKKAWWKEAVVYQIYPRSFMDSNGDGVGDIRGIIQKLDYLKLLGIDVIWLSPVYKSPNDDNGYDISDYQDIMEEFGTMEDFDELLAKAHEKGLKIVMDLVVNHTSDEHKWFIESRKDRENKYRDYYIWRDPKEDKSEPNNWGSCFGGSAWEYDEHTDSYFLHLFSKKQPDLNWDNKEVREEVFSMMDWWCKKGIDGFRMDVISMISKVPELPDGETGDGLYGDFSPYTVHGPHVHDYLKEMNRSVLSKYDLMTVGETSGVTIEQAKKYAGENENELNMVFQFEHVEGDGIYGKWTDKPRDLTELKQIMSKWQTELYESAWNSLFWDNHDQPRAVSRFGNDSDEYRELSAKMLATCLHMMQGTPYIYQGEELGMTNFPFTDLSQFRDIESINAFDEWTNKGGIAHDKMMSYLRYKGRDNARTPMQWNNEANAGFTTGIPWISVNPNYKEINAERELEDTNSVFYYYQKLIQLRKQKEIIVYGKYELIMADSKEIFAYKRSHFDKSLLVLCNFSSDTAKVEIPKEFMEGKVQAIIGNYDALSKYSLHENTQNEQADVITKNQLRPYEAVVLEKL